MANPTAIPFPSQHHSGGTLYVHYGYDGSTGGRHWDGGLYRNRITVEMEVKPGKIIYVTDTSRANLKTELLTSSSTTNPTSSVVKTTATGTTYVRMI